MRTMRLIVTAGFILGVAACSDSGPAPAMPDVEGAQLDVALSDIDRAGFSGDVEVVGGGVFGVLDESNWLVCEQVPAAGQGVTDEPRLTVDRECEGDASGDTSTEQPSDAPVSEAESEVAPSETVVESSTSPEVDEDRILNVSNNADMAGLLSDDWYEVAAEFAEIYEGQLIEFDGSVYAWDYHEDYDTRFDFIIAAGDFDADYALGPSFKFEDVNRSDLNLIGDDLPEGVAVGDRFHFVVRVDEYNSDTQVFFVEPVSTEVREWGPR